MQKMIRIGTRESHLAVWQAKQVQMLLKESGFTSELIYIRSEGDLDQKTPLYALGVQGIFTRSLDLALLNGKIDLAVHSMKDVPVQLAKGIIECAVLKRGPAQDILVYKGDWSTLQAGLSIVEKEEIPNMGSATSASVFTVATGSIRRKAQWLNKYPWHRIEDLRGNIDSRLRKLYSGVWDAAIFAQAGLERIQLRPSNSMILEWMLPAPAQGAILVVGKEDDPDSFEACQSFHHQPTAFCTKIERDFLRKLQGGCSTPVGALAEIENEEIYFRGNMLSLDGSRKVEVERILPVENAFDLGLSAGEELLNRGGQEIADHFSHAGQ